MRSLGQTLAGGAIVLLAFTATPHAQEPTPSPSIDPKAAMKDPGALIKATPEFVARAKQLREAERFKLAPLSIQQPSVDIANYLKTTKNTFVAFKKAIVLDPSGDFSTTGTSPSTFILLDSFFSDELFRKNLELLKSNGIEMNRLVGGGPVPAPAMRFCVAVMDDLKLTYCTGILISPRLVLTAHHCAGAGPKPKSIFVGETVGTGGTQYEVKTRYTIPPTHIYSDADLLLLELKEPVKDVEPLRIAKDEVPADFPSETNDVGFRLLRVVGFGRQTATGGGPIGIKMFADVPAHGGSGAILGFDPHFEFSAGLHGLEIDTCKGDSGGPAMAYDTKAERFVLIGAVSRGVTPQKNDNPAILCGNGGVYTRVDLFKDWIISIAKSINDPIEE